MEQKDFNKELENVIDEFLKIDFQNLKKVELIEHIDYLYQYYKKIFEYRSSITDKKIARRNVLLGINEKEIMGNVEKLSRNHIKSLMENEEETISYLYGAYISNRIAHEFKTKSRRKRNNINENRIAKKFYALKSIFTKYLVDKLRETTRYEFAWEKDNDNDAMILTVSITPYSKKKVQEYHEKTGKSAEHIYISLHVVDPNLTNVIKDLPNRKLAKGNKPIEIFNISNDIRRLYKEGVEENGDERL